MQHAIPPGRTGILLINTGSSAAPRVPETRAYLRQFLSDPRIIDLPAWKRWIIVNCFILPFRPKRTAHAYAAVWTDRGSPLIAFSEDFRDALHQRMPETLIEIGMAYGEPSIPRAMDKLLAQPIQRLVLVPMFPQYSSATTGSVLECAYKHAASRWNVPALSVVPPYYDDNGFLDAWATLARQHLAPFQPEHVLLSYHGLPERQIFKGDPTGSHCLKRPDCCDTPTAANDMCYRRQCMETTRGIVQRLQLDPSQYSVTFQSRLGRDPWLSPATDETITALAKRGIKRLAVLSPAFTADCLETLEEIGIGGKENFLEHGGEHFLLVPSLNALPQWADAMATIIHRLGVA
jgi:ferrochelatase